MLDRDLARPVEDVRPAVAQMSKPQALAPVVAAHVAPTLLRAVMAQATIEFYVDAPFLDDDVEDLNPVLRPAHLTGPGRQPVEAAQSCVSNLQRRLGASGHIR